jgi:NADPH2:quinone reductase
MVGMRAVLLNEFGPPEVLVPAEVAEPAPSDAEVLIEVEYSNLTFVETQVRAGHPPHPAMLPALPAILGNGVGGVVAQAGPGHEALIGRPVIASLGGAGGYAQRAVSAPERLIEVPDGMAMRDAVALLADGRTACGLVRLAALGPGDRVLVEAAGGGVGTLLVQLASNAGARVLALAGAEAKLQLALELGAEVAINYRDDDWARQVRSAVGEVDVVFDGVGGPVGLGAFQLLGAGGRFCPFGMASGAFAPVSAESSAARGVVVRRAGPSGPVGLAELTRAALAEAAAGRLRAAIGREFALEEAAAAHTAIEARATVGKTLLRAGTGGSGR